ncbi:hypothetical protein F4777DRAFT_421871 [Nemania sp. FL0916]|nr:hypothetical protein F4777DRAFT_421871 [Nemania sp. FL0916]
MQAASPFFSLPGEIRERIYDFYLTHSHSSFGDTLRPYQKYLETEPSFSDSSSDAASASSYSRPLPALMLTCKQAYQEMRSAVHEQAILRVEMPGGSQERRIGFAVHGTLVLARLRKLTLLVPSQVAYWNAWLDFFGDVLKQTQGLRVLVVDWSPRGLVSGRKSKPGLAGLAFMKKEEAFLEMIESLPELHTLVVHGDIPAMWIERLQKKAPRFVQHRERWWREPGMDL